jgi:outer membrane murein-binding lipoprotein Lpp
METMKKTKIGAVVLSLLILSGCQKPMVSSGTSEVSSLPESTETSSSTAVSSSTALSSKAVSSSVSSSVETLYGITAFHNMTTAKVILSGIAVGDHFKAGTSLTAVFTFDAFLSGTKAYVNATAMALFQNTEKPDEYSFTFTMPKEDVVLTLFIPFTPSEDGSIYTIVLKDTHASVWGIENGEKIQLPFV